MTDDSPATLVCEPWATTEQVLASGVNLDDIPEDTELLDDAVSIASDILFALSGRRWRGGGCTRIVTLEPRPYRRPRSLAWNHRRLVEVARLELLFGRTDRAHPLWLPDWPVTEITSVHDHEDVVVDPSLYQLRNARRLDRLDPDTGRRAWWPRYHFTVAYTYGQPPPAGGVRAAITLAAQIALAAVGSSECRFPKRVTSITRQGVSMAILDPMEFITKGQTGLPDVDLWIASVNPNGGRRRPTVWSPDVDTRDQTYGGAIS